MRRSIDIASLLVRASTTPRERTTERPVTENKVIYNTVSNLVTDRQCCSAVRLSILNCSVAPCHDAPAQRGLRQGTFLRLKYSQVLLVSVIIQILMIIVLIVLSAVRTLPSYTRQCLYTTAPMRHLVVLNHSMADRWKQKQIGCVS